MIKTPTILLILFVQISTLNWESLDISSILAEIGILIIAVSLGSGLRIAWKSRGRKRVSRRDSMIIFFVGLSLGFAANYAMIYAESTWPRPLVVWFVSLFGEFIMLFFENNSVELLKATVAKIFGLKMPNTPDQDSDDETDEPFIP